MSEETKKIELGREGLYDARKLGVPKMLVLGVQHTFAMFGATVLVPILTGISVSTALLFAGIGTLLFHLLTKGKVPAFLGSSFAFLGGYAAVAPLGADGTPSEMLPYAAGGIVVSGLIYVILSALIKVFGVRKIMRFFPPVVTGPIIISIGLILGAQRHHELSVQLAFGIYRAGRHRGMQHLGQGYGEDPAHPHRYRGLLYRCTLHGRGGFYRHPAGRLVRPGHPYGQHGQVQRQRLHHHCAHRTGHHDGAYRRHCSHQCHL